MTSGNVRTPPRWAQELVARVCEREAPRRTPPVLVWSCGKKPSDLSASSVYGHRTAVRYDRDFTAGRMTPADNTIAIYAGRLRVDQRATLLHELAHWMNAERVRHHDQYFWRALLALFTRYMRNLDYTNEAASHIKGLRR